MNKPHVHADLIKAWADGAEIQYRNRRGEWEDVGPVVSWLNNSDYRIKPTLPSINWDHVSDRYNYLLVKDNGTTILLEEFPSLGLTEEGDPMWGFEERYAARIFTELHPIPFESFDAGTVRGRDSLIERPRKDKE